MDILKIDKNFKSKSPIEKENIIWYDIREAVFDIYGLFNPKNGKKFCRIPQEVAKSINNDVLWLSTNTAGGRVRFSTDSSYIAISVDQPNTTLMSHMAMCGSSGFDLYHDCTNNHNFIASFRPDTNKSNGFASYIDLCGSAKEKGLHSFTLNFPLYCDVNSVHIGIENGSRLDHGKKYRDSLPFVYYGSSITQGGCASRPGTCYQNYICRRYDIDYINLGFSGSAKGEKEMAEYISEIPMSIFICDYDHNAPNPEHLGKTHFEMYKTIREKNPDLPYLMITKPDVLSHPTEAMNRKAAIKRVYNTAVENGDKNIYFLDGSTLFDGDCFGECTVDGCHPNDLGFYRMAKVIGDKINSILF